MPRDGAWAFLAARFFAAGGDEGDLLPPRLGALGDGGVVADLPRNTPREGEHRGVALAEVGFFELMMYQRRYLILCKGQLCVEVPPN